MPYGLKRGMGGTSALPTVFGSPYHCEYAQNWALNPQCWSMSTTAWQQLVTGTVAPPQAPTGDVLTVPPASGEQAQATVDALVNQQMVDQQALNAGNVTSSWWDTLTGGTYGAASAAASGLSSSLPWILGALGLGIFALVAMGGGRPRRYGR